MAILEQLYITGVWIMKEVMDLKYRFITVLYKIFVLSKPPIYLKNSHILNS